MSIQDVHANHRPRPNVFAVYLYRQGLLVRVEVKDVCRGFRYDVSSRPPLEVDCEGSQTTLRDTRSSINFQTLIARFCQRSTLAFNTVTYLSKGFVSAGPHCRLYDILAER